MPNKFPGRHLAVGLWSSPWRTIRNEAVATKIRVQLQDKLISRGMWAYLYTPVAPTDSGVIVCTCDKDTTKSSEYPCLSCYGTKFAPGYKLFLSDPQFWCSAELNNFTLANVVNWTLIKPNRLILAPNATSGTITTQDKPYNNPNAQDYPLKLEAYLRAAGQTITLQVSTNAGSTWTSVALTPNPSPGYGFTGTVPAAALVGTGNVRFQITMTRASINDKEPAFEILRIRRVRTEDENRETIRHRPDHISGCILMLRPWVTEYPQLTAGQGRLIDHQQERMWCAPLDFYDQSILHDTPACRINDDFGPHAFYQYSRGVQAETRYAMTTFSFNEQFGIFTHQSMITRRAQQFEPPYGNVW